MCACCRACFGGSSDGLLALHHAGKLSFHGDLAGLADERAFAAFLAPFRKTEWVIWVVPQGVV